MRLNTWEKKFENAITWLSKSIQFTYEADWEWLHKKKRGLASPLGNIWNHANVSWKLNLCTIQAGTAVTSHRECALEASNLCHFCFDFRKEAGFFLLLGALYCYLRSGLCGFCLGLFDHFYQPFFLAHRLFELRSFLFL